MKGSSIFPYIYSLRVFLTGTSDPEVPRWSPSLGPNHPGVRFFHPFRFQGGEILFGKDPKLGRISWEFLLFCWRFVFERRPPIFFPANVSLEMLFFLEFEKLFFGEVEKLFPWFAWHHGKWQKLYSYYGNLEEQRKSSFWRPATWKNLASLGTPLVGSPTKKGLRFTLPQTKTVSKTCQVDKFRLDRRLPTIPFSGACELLVSGRLHV